MTESEWPDAQSRQQAVLIAAALVYLWVAGRTVRRFRPRWLPLWFAGFAAWAVIPKYFLCTRCENYGKPCDFVHGGKYAAKLYKRQDKPVGMSGVITEASSMAIFELLPLAAAWRHPRALLSYALAGLLMQSVLIKVCCVKCVANARDPWKRKYCPTFKLVEALGLAHENPDAPSCVLKD